jgi:hypothetical protein
VQCQHLVGFAQPGFGLEQRVGVDVEQRHAVAVRQEPFGHGQADAARAAGDDGDRGR